MYKFGDISPCNIQKPGLDWTIRVFFSGDYEFLCSMYGLSGASGKLLPTTLVGWYVGMTQIQMAASINV